MISIDDALEKLLSSVRHRATDYMELVSDKDHPFCDKSSMDGYAVASAHLASPRKIIGTIYAGEDSSMYAMGPCECFKIMTGACIPRGADAIVPIEQCYIDNDLMTPMTQVLPGNFVRKRGSHAKENEVLLPPHHSMNAPRLGLYAQVGQSLPMRAPLKIIICSTGNELSDQPSEFQIRDSNWHSLSYLLMRLGVTSTRGPILPDNPFQIASFINDQQYDVLITTGGVSAGDKDYLPRVLKEIGAEIIFHKINLKPGMPMLAAKKNDKLILGLPGNPVSSYVTSLIFLPPLLATLRGTTSTIGWTRGVLDKDVNHNGNKEWVIPAFMNDGRLTPTKSLDSSDLVALARADAVIRISSSMKKGDDVYYQSIL